LVSYIRNGWKQCVRLQKVVTDLLFVYKYSHDLFNVSDYFHYGITINQF
jgi:hypothetical protein